MIIAKITMHILPEKRLEVIQTFLSMIEPIGKETGCLNYSVSYDIEDNNHFTLLEEWETRENLDHHIMSRRFDVLLGIKTLLCEPPEVQIYTVSYLEGMEVVNAVRRKRTQQL